MTPASLCRRHGMSDAAFTGGAAGTADGTRPRRVAGRGLKGPEEEKQRLKRRVAGQPHGRHVRKDVQEKTGRARRAPNRHRAGDGQMNTSTPSDGGGQLKNGTKPAIAGRNGDQRPYRPNAGAQPAAGGRPPSPGHRSAPYPLARSDATSGASPHWRMR